MVAIIAFTSILLTGLVPFVHSSPILGRDNDGTQPITWISPEGDHRCWHVGNGQIVLGQVLVV